MYKNNCFDCLKGGMIGADKGDLAILKNKPLKEHDPEIYIEEYPSHVKICNRMKEKGQEYKHWEYMFKKQNIKMTYWKSKEKENEYYERTKDFEEQWINYINILPLPENMNENNIDEIVENIYKKLESNGKVIPLPIKSHNGSDRYIIEKNYDVYLCFDFYQWVDKNQDISFIFKDTLTFGNKRKESKNYEYNENTFDNLSLVEKVGTLVAIWVGQKCRNLQKYKNVIRDFYNIIDISPKDKESIIPFISKFSKKEKEINFSDLKKYFFNNEDKVQFDFYLGSKICNKIDLNAIINRLEVSIIVDNDKLKCLEQIDFADYKLRKIKHFSLSKDITFEDILKNYLLYGYRYLNTKLDFNSLCKFDFFLYLILKPNCFYLLNKIENSYDENLVYKIFKNINRFFNEKDNHLQRKQKFYLDYNDQPIEKIIEYHNKINKNKVDLELFCGNISVELKKQLFEIFFMR